jgi:medium-chain acyl-[acyl-carrier-protein] hydrolase
MPVDSWTESLRVRGHEVTPRGVVSLPALCTYLPDVAGRHAEALGVSMRSLRAENKAWILSHLHLTIDRLPRWEEEIVVETWPSDLDGLRATREFVLSVDDTEVARATSAWLVFDTDRRRPARLPEAVHDLDLPDCSPVLPHAWDDVPRPQRTDHTQTFEARYSDLDLNRHVNSARLLEWALAPLPADHLDTHTCTEMRLQFRAETTLDDIVRSTVQIDDTDEERRVRHALHRADDEQVLIAADTRWIPHEDLA